MGPKIERVVLPPQERMVRATDFLVRLKDSADKRLDSFESYLLSNLIDEYIDLVKFFNQSTKRGK